MRKTLTFLAILAVSAPDQEGKTVELAKVAAKANVKSPADLKAEADLVKLTESVAASDAGKQDIRGDVYVSPNPSMKVTLPRSFTVLGQKFVIDSWVTSKTVFDDIVWDERKVGRRVPSCLDVSFTALGNNHVVPELEQRMVVGSHPFRDRKNYQARRGAYGSFARAETRPR